MSNPIPKGKYTFILQKPSCMGTMALSPEKFTELWKAVFKKACTGEDTELSSDIAPSYSYIVEEIMKASDAYQERCKKNLSNIRKRWDKVSPKDTNELRLNTNVIPNDMISYDTPPKGSKHIEGTPLGKIYDE